MNHKNTNMPKISKENIRVDTKDTNHTFEITVNYNKDHHFYATLPDEVIDSFNAMNDTERKKIGGFTFYKPGERHGGTGRPAISSATHEKLIQDMKKAIATLFEVSLIKRQVIVIDFNSERGYSRSGGYTHEPTGFSLGLTYCTEVRVGAKDPKFYKYDKDYWNEDRKTEVYISSRKDAAIIDDTPENRKFLEDIYKAVKILGSKLQKYTKNDKSIMELITSNTILLPAPNEQEVKEVTEKNDDDDEEDDV